MSDDPCTLKITMFEVVAKVLRTGSASEIFYITLQEIHMYHISVAECMIHFRWKRLPGNEMLRQVDYNAIQEAAKASKLQKCH